MDKKSFTGVSWITCIGAKIICFIFMFKREKNKIFGVLFCDGLSDSHMLILRSTEQLCYLIEVGNWKERADIEVIKSSLLIKNNSSAEE